MSQYASSAEEIVTESLMNYGGRKKSTGTGVMIVCPFHDDNGPSFGINLSTDSGIPLGYGHCLGCGKNAPWNETAAKMGFPLLKKSDTKITSYKQRQRGHLLTTGLSLKEVVTKEFRCSEFLPKWPADKEWRTIDGELMNKFAYNAFNPELAKEFAILPVTIDGEMHGAIKAVTKRTDDEDELAYVTSKGGRQGWVKKYGLFPYDVVAEMLEQTGLRTVVLTEGPRDSLRLINFGIPALSLLGCKAWSPTKKKILLSLPIDRVILLMDGDHAGKAASEAIAPTLNRLTDLVVYDLYTPALKLGKKIDPASMTSRRREKIRELLI